MTKLIVAFRNFANAPQNWYLRNLKFVYRCWGKFLFVELWHLVDRFIGTDVSEQLVASVLRTVQENVLPWRWRQQVPKQNHNLYAIPDAVATQKNEIFINTAVRVSCLELSQYFFRHSVFPRIHAWVVRNKDTFTKCVHYVCCVVLITDLLSCDHHNGVTFTTCEKRQIWMSKIWLPFLHMWLFFKRLFTFDLRIKRLLKVHYGWIKSWNRE